MIRGKLIQYCLVASTVVAAVVLIRAAPIGAQENQVLEIHGTVRIAGTGEPVSGVMVEHFGPNHPVFDPDADTVATTDASGRFSFSGMEVGEHRLRPVPPGLPDGTYLPATEVLLLESGPLPSVDVWVLPLSSITGRITSAEGEALPGACVEARRAVSYRGQNALLPPAGLPLSACRADEEGRYLLVVPPGAYYIRVRQTEGGAHLAPVQYFPGTPDLAEAVPISVRGGVDQAGLDFTLSESEAYRLRFHLPLPEYLPGVPEPLVSYLDDGDPLLDMHIQRRGAGLTDLEGLRISPASLGEDLWETMPLSPGEYDVLIAYGSRMISNIRRALDGGTYDSRIDRLMPFSLMSVVVEDGDVDLGTVGETPKVAVAGRVAFRAMSGTASYSGELPGQILAGFATGGVARRSAPGDDGAFAFEWVPPGVFEFRVDPEDVQEGWRLASVRSGGRDVLLDGVEVGGAAVPLEVVYANDGVRIEGVVRRPDGALLPGAHVVLVPPANRRGPFAQFPTAAAGSSGGFLLEDVPPGSYRLLALDLMGNPDAYPFWQSPDFLRRYEFRGELITVDPGARLTINPEAIPLVE